MEKRLILVGAGNFGRELINWVSDAADTGVGSRFAGFLDTNQAAFEGYSYALPWLGTVDSFTPNDNDLFIVAIANPESRRTYVQQLKEKGASFATFIHPSAVIAKSAVFGEGLIVCPQSIISSDAQVGNFVVVNVLSSIGHDARVGDFSTLSAHVDLTGFVQVGESVFFGSGARVLPKVKIGDNAKIGAGATVMRAVPTDATMYIPPAKRL